MMIKMSKENLISHIVNFLQIITTTVVLLQFTVDDRGGPIWKTCRDLFCAIYIVRSYS